MVPLLRFPSINIVHAVFYQGIQGVHLPGGFSSHASLKPRLPRRYFPSPIVVPFLYIFREGPLPRNPISAHFRHLRLFSNVIIRWCLSGWCPCHVSHPSELPTPYPAVFYQGIIVVHLPGGCPTTYPYIRSGPGSTFRFLPLRLYDISPGRVL